jgi:hypothetical protein
MLTRKIINDLGDRHDHNELTQLDNLPLFFSSLILLLINPWPRLN